MSLCLHYWMFTASRRGKSSSAHVARSKPSQRTGSVEKARGFSGKKKTTGPIGQMVFLSRKPFLMSSLRFFLLEMVEVAGVEPASLVLSYVASTCLAFNLLSLLNRLNASYPVSRLPKYN